MSITVAAAAIAFDIEPLRGRNADAAIGCLFERCAIAELNGDGMYSSADVIAAIQIGSKDPRRYTRIVIERDPSRNGVFDASLVFPIDSGDGWMAYSGVDYHQQDAVLVRDVTTRIGFSADGLTWQMRATVNPPQAATVTVGNTALCGQSRCTGRMISEVPFLVDDAADPDPHRRFKLFAHRYFLYPPVAARGQDLQPQLGSINVRTAARPAGPWSDDTALLGWNLTPPEIDAAINVNQVDPAMGVCAAISEGGALAIDDALDFVFTCPHLVDGMIRDRIVLLRSTDHAASFTFVATLLDENDAASLGADDLSAPSLFSAAGRIYLLVTPVIGSNSGQYAGCMLIAFSDRDAGQLERDRDGSLIVREILPTEGDRFGGACAWDPRAAGGIVMSELFFDGTTASFRLFATGVRIPGP